jgi:hypothetical protein
MFSDGKHSFAIEVWKNSSRHEDFRACTEKLNGLGVQIGVVLHY